MSIQIDLPPEWEARLREEAARQGKDAGRYVSDLLKRQLVAQELDALQDRKPPQSVDDLQPRIPPPPGKSWLEAVVGEWPGDESDHEVQRILEEIS